MNRQNSRNKEELKTVLFTLLHTWLVEENREKAYDYFMSLSAQDRFITSKALREVVSTSSSPELRQAAKDIPAFIKSKL